MSPALRVLAWLILAALAAGMFGWGGLILFALLTALSFIADFLKQMFRS